MIFNIDVSLEANLLYAGLFVGVVVLFMLAIRMEIKSRNDTYKFLALAIFAIATIIAMIDSWLAFMQGRFIAAAVGIPMYYLAWKAATEDWQRTQVLWRIEHPAGESRLKKLLSFPNKTTIAVTSMVRNWREKTQIRREAAEARRLLAQEVAKERARAIVARELLEQEQAKEEVKALHVPQEENV